MIHIYRHLPENVKSFIYLKSIKAINSKECPKQKNRPCSNKQCCLGKENNCTRNNCQNKLVG